MAFVPKTNNSDTPPDTALETGIVNSLIANAVADEATGETNLDPDANRELLLSSCDEDKLSVKAKVPIEKNAKAQNLCTNGAPYAVNNKAYSFNQNNYCILKEAVKGVINSDTTACAIMPSSCHARNQASNKGLEKITTSSEIAKPQGEVSNVLSSETAGHTPTPCDPQRELPPRETDTLTLHNDTVRLVSDGEHDGHKIVSSLETTIPYDPTPISLCFGLQELHSPLSNSSEGLADCAAAGMREGIGTPLSPIEEDGLVFNEMH